MLCPNISIFGPKNWYTRETVKIGVEVKVPILSFIYLYQFYRYTCGSIIFSFIFYTYGSLLSVSVYVEVQVPIVSFIYLYQFYLSSFILCVSVGVEV